MAASPYDNKEIVACSVIPGSGVMFGFRSPDGVTEATRQLLGHVDGIQENGSYIPGFILGANFPKPPRMQKRGVGNYYCAIDKTNEARASGWSMSEPAKYLRGGTRRKSVLVSVDMRQNDETGNPTGPQLKIARYMRNTTKARITDGDLSAMGVNTTTASDSDLIYGAEYPIPPEARFTAVNTEQNVDTYGTMVDPKRLDNLPAGWVVTSNGKY